MSKWSSKYVTITETTDVVSGERCFTVFEETLRKRFIGIISIRNGEFDFFQCSKYIGLECAKEIKDFCRYLNKKPMTSSEFLEKLSNLIKEYEYGSSYF